MIPLNLREATPPSDVIPALRPQLTGPVVESTVDSILDAIRHEKISAVGIIATDDRDVLFLAREVKRASPDVQLFLFGTHGSVSASGLPALPAWRPRRLVVRA